MDRQNTFEKQNLEIILLQEKSFQIHQKEKITWIW